MVHPITKYGQPVLENKCQEIHEFDTPELHKLLEDMFESMYAARGVGLAAPQIGLGKRIAVIDVTTGEDPAQKIVLINPVILKQEGSQTSEEGCLSLPGFREPVTRARRATIRAQDAKGNMFEMTGDDLLARAFLHETDHLNGTLYINHISPLKRDLIRRKIRKLQKSDEWGD
jgi:peptide deformylase